MLFRSDDICHTTELNKLREITDILNCQQMFAVIPFSDFLKENEDRALVEKKIEDNSEIIGYLKHRINCGDIIALHGWKHVVMRDFKMEEVVFEIMKARDYLEKLFNIEIKHFVPPCHVINEEQIYWINKIGLEVVTDKNGEDINVIFNEKRGPSLGTEMIWYHWWSLDTEKLRIWQT